MDHVTLSIAVARGVFAGALLLTLLWGMRNLDRRAGKTAIVIALLLAGSLFVFEPDPPSAAEVVPWQEYFK